MPHDPLSKPLTLNSELDIKPTGQTSPLFNLNASKRSRVPHPSFLGFPGREVIYQGFGDMLVGVVWVPEIPNIQCLEPGAPL